MRHINCVAYLPVCLHLKDDDVWLKLVTLLIFFCVLLLISLWLVFVFLLFLETREQKKKNLQCSNEKTHIESSNNNKLFHFIICLNTVEFCAICGVTLRIARKPKRRERESPLSFLFISCDCHSVPTAVKKWKTK